MTAVTMPATAGNRLIDVDRLMLPPQVREHIKRNDLIPGKYWILSYDHDADTLTASMSDNSVDPLTAPRNDGSTNDALREISKTIKASEYDLWPDPSVARIDDDDNCTTIVMNLRNDDFPPASGSTDGKTPAEQSSDILEKWNELFKYDRTRMVYFNTKPGLLEDIVKAEWAYREFRDDLRPAWLNDQDSPIRAYEFLDKHPMAWYVDRSQYINGSWDDHIITEGLFSRMMGWQTFEGDLLEVEPSPYFHDIRLDHVSKSMDDIIVTVAKRLDHYYDLDGEMREDADGTEA